MYYRLKPEVYLVQGKIRAILTNILSGDIISIDNNTRQLIEKAELNNEFADENDLLNKLCDMGWMQVENKAVFVEKIRFTNVFTKKRAWKYFPQTEVVIMQITNKCNSPCGLINCSSNFCPICIKFNNVSKELSFEQWKEIMDKFRPLAPKNIILTGGNPLFHKDFEKIYKYAKDIFKNVFVHINKISDIQELSSDCMTYISLFNENDINKFNLLKNKNNIIALYDHDSKKVDQGIRVNLSKPKISKSSFQNKMTLAQHFTRRMYDGCLLGRISVLYDGTIVPCLGCHNKKIGNILEEDFVEVMRKLYFEYWEKEIDTRTDKKCGYCEYRYNCSSCIKFSDENCTYSLEDGVWK
jgi:radical SAM protein with 4Fe4S-binding SPASM domain